MTPVAEALNACDDHDGDDFDDLPDHPRFKSIVPLRGFEPT